ncbi:MAG TPA: DciA family protein [Quisquiliibacterium sp.]|nr:DciA family protein [Quisquiliibacterium sp.]HQD84402.1 DciA family protein [Quisquiliibacterium sp.]
MLAWLGRHQGFDALTARAEVLLALQADLDRLDTSATGGARRLTALGLQDDVLVLSAPGAALAAKLRQIEPSLLAGLAVRGWKVKRIRIQPQPPRQGAPTPPPTPKAPVPASAVAAFEALGRQVDDPGLKRALARFVARRRRSGP